MAILIADLYYESEQHQKALSIYRRLEENRELGTLSKNEKAYVVYGIFACLCWVPKINENLYLRLQWNDMKNTPSEKRALAGYARRLGNNQPNIFVLEEKLSKEKMNEYLLIKQKLDSIIEKGLTFYQEYCIKYKNGTYFEDAQNEILNLNKQKELILFLSH
jgi:hypothetical protein